MFYQRTISDINFLLVHENINFYKSNSKNVIHLPSTQNIHRNKLESSSDFPILASYWLGSMPPWYSEYRIQRQEIRVQSIILFLYNLFEFSHFYNTPNQIEEYQKRTIVL